MVIYTKLKETVVGIILQTFALVRHVFAGLVGEFNQISFVENNRIGDASRANFWPFDVHHQRNDSPFLLADFANAIDRFIEPLVTGMSHIETADVNALPNESR